MKIILHLIALVCQILFTIGDENQTSLACQKWSKSHLHFTKAYFFSGFNMAFVEFETFAQLNIKCGHLVEMRLYMLGIKPTVKNLLIDYTFDIRLFLDSFLFEFDEIYLSIHNLKGFNLNLSNSRHLIEHNIYTSYFSDSYFDFYLNHTQLITKEQCARSNFEHSIFNFGQYVFFSNIYYSKNVCPYVFMKSTFKCIIFESISNSFLYKNQLEFLSLNETEDFQLPNIRSMTVNVAHDHISTRLVNRNIFNNVRSFILQGYFYGIQEDLFESFKHLREIFIIADSFAVLFSQGNKWMNQINSDVNQSLDSINFLQNISIDMSRTVYLVFYDKIKDDTEAYIFKRIYAYPNEDLCLFKDFPHQQLVFPVFETSEPIKCTCTVMWLIQHSDIYMNLYAERYIGQFSNVNVYVCSQRIECNFTQQFAKCAKSQAFRRVKKLGLIEETNLYFHLKLLQYLVEICIQPLLCVISILTNLLVILTLRNKTGEIKKNLANVMYDHIQVNALFNIVYAVIKLVSLINLCVYPRTSFCSDIYKLPASQYFKIYVVYFAGNTARLCCNTSYIFFSVSRYYLSTSNSSPFFNKFQKVNLRVFYTLVLGISLSFSVFKVFQFQVNEFITTFDTDYPFDGYGVNYCHAKGNADLQEFVVSKAKCDLFAALNVINNILNNICFMFISILIDVGLVRFTNQNLVRKRRLFVGREAHDVNQAIKLKEKVNKMVIANGLLYFVSHAPEFTTTIFLLAFNKQLSIYCADKFSCVELVDTAQVFNLLSMGFQILIFKHFNTNFDKSLDNVLSKTFCKSSKKTSNAEKNTSKISQPK